MKKLYSILIICMMFLSTSCVTSAQCLSYYDEYLYLNNYYPVVYIDTYPYYFYNSQWIRIHVDNYRLIRHLNGPCYYRGNDYYHFSNRGFYSRHPMHQPDRRFDNHKPQIHQRPNVEVHRPGNNHRPSVIRGNQGNYRLQTSKPYQNNRGGHSQGNRGGRR